MSSNREVVPGGFCLLWLLALGVVALTQPAGAATPTIALVPVGASGPHTLDGDTIVLEAGQTVEVEVRISDWDADGDGDPLLMIWEVLFNPDVFTSGFQGIVAPAAVPCTSDAECQATIDPRSTCASGYDAVPRCAPIFFDKARPDYVFSGVGDLPGFDPPGPVVQFRIASAALGSVPDPHTPQYAATLLLDISPDAFGVFTIGFDPSFSALYDDTTTAIEPLSLLPARIIVTEPTCGAVNDCSGHGTCVGPDVCECDPGWAGNDCSMFGCFDLSDCSGHGTCVAPNVCECQAGWLGDDCSMEAGGVVSLVPVWANGNYRLDGNDITVFPGDYVMFEIHIEGWDRDLTGAPLLSAWQVTIDSSSFANGDVGVMAPFRPSCAPSAGDKACFVATGGAAPCDADLTCAPAFLSEREDFVFPSVHGAQVDSSGNDIRFADSLAAAGAVDPGTPAYAGEFLLEISPDAAGTFTIQLLPGPDGTFLLDETGNSIEPLALVSAKVHIAAPDDDFFVRTNRYLTIHAGRPGRTAAMRVTCVDLAGEFAALNGSTFWVQEPEKLSEYSSKNAQDSVGPGEPFIWTASADCLSSNPIARDWAGFAEPIYVYNELIVPDSTYAVQFVDALLSPNVETNFTRPFLVTTASWGDVAGVFDVEQQRWTPPGTTVGVLADILDVVALLDAFVGSPTAPIKARWDLLGPNVGAVDGQVNMTEVLASLSAFSNAPYPFSPTGPPCPE